MRRVRGTWKRTTGGLLAVALSVGLSGEPVAAQSSARGLGDQLRAANADYEQTVSEGTVLGIAAGALIGGAIGAARGRGGGGALGGAAIGALAGGLLGNIGGRAVAENKADQIRQESQLDKAIAQARAGNAKLASIVGMAGRLVAARRAELARLAKSGDDAARRRLAAGLAEEVATLDASLATARNTRDTLRANAANFSGRGAAALAGEAERAGSQITSLQARRSELAQMQKGL